jgi:hypothetical protein
MRALWHMAEVVVMAVVLVVATEAALVAGTDGVDMEVVMDGVVTEAVLVVVTGGVDTEAVLVADMEGATGVDTEVVSEEVMSEDTVIMAMV